MNWNCTCVSLGFFFFGVLFMEYLPGRAAFTIGCVLLLLCYLGRPKKK